MNSLILGKTTAGVVVPVQVDSAGTANERVSTIVHSSASLGLSYTETFVYAGSAGAYRISTITRS